MCMQGASTEPSLFFQVGEHKAELDTFSEVLEWVASFVAPAVIMDAAAFLTLTGLPL